MCTNRTKCSNLKIVFSHACLFACLHYIIYLQDAQTLIERKLASVDLEPAVSDVVIPNGEGEDTKSDD